MFKQCCKNLFDRKKNNKHGGAECSTLSKEPITPILCPIFFLSISKMLAYNMPTM